MTDAKTKPEWLRLLNEPFHFPTSFGRVVMAILIVFFEGVLFLQVPRVVAMFQALGVERLSLPGRFIQAYPLLCQGIGLSIALFAVWAWGQKRGRILTILFCFALLQVGLDAWAITQVPFEHLTTRIHP